MNWDSVRLRAVLEDLRRFGDDTTLVECKRARSGMPESLGESICAFANMPEGGTILLGIDEHAGFSVTGVEDPADMEKKAVNLCRQTIQPAPPLIFEHLDVEGKHVVVISVTPIQPSLKPATFNGQPYLRQADGDYIMNPNDLRLIGISAWHESERKDFDHHVLAGVGLNQLNSELVDDFCRTARRNNPRLRQLTDDDLLLQVTNVTDDQGNVRLAGLYALGLYPQATEPALGATAAVRLSRHTDEQARTKNLRDIEGPIPQLVSETVQWIADNTSTVQAYKENGHMEDRPEFPLQAIREIVANAFVHRDLGPSTDVGKRVEVRLTDSALIIQSPGGLRGLSVAQLKSVELTKAPVNPRLYSIARYLHTPNGERIIEGEGGGIREALLAIKRARLHPPKLINTGTQFKVIFPRGPRHSPEEREWLASMGDRFSAPQEDILLALRKGERYSWSRLRAEYTPMAESELRSQVSQLFRAALITDDADVYSLAAPFPTATHNESEETDSRPPTSSAPAPQHTTPENNESLPPGKNVRLVFNTLASGGKMNLDELIAATKLSANQVRYALKPLIVGSFVTMTGGQGRSTTYAATQQR